MEITSSISFHGLEAHKILAELPSIAASAGAACHADGVTISSVLEAMAVPLAYARGTVRFSNGRFISEADIDRALHDIIQVIVEMRS